MGIKLVGLIATGGFSQCQNDPSADDDLWNLATGCRPRVLSYNSYDVNGYRFSGGEEDCEEQVDDGDDEDEDDEENGNDLEYDDDDY
ncbi:hypothetical protein E2562_025868 [Oryza meyeriana var. granulata]|uniref:Uncharacterized protein n=1 Tax=Oryza meyeriana var. granulata TaxID=110450 RepID=A0A6G1D7U8_9ORYZ|nr:hypothetical protein E2562_025868 [Oryza meyeriana var. granulata]